MANPRRSNNVNQVPATEEKEDQHQNTNESTVSGISGVTNPLAAIEMPSVGVSVDMIRSSATEEKEDPRLVEMIVEYPEDFKGKKYLKDGQLIKVSPETAQRFETLGIAKKVEGLTNYLKSNSKQS